MFKSFALIATSLASAFLLWCTVCTRHAFTDNPALAWVSVIIPFLLPYCGFRFFRSQQDSSPYKPLVFLAFFFSVIPAVIFLTLLSVRLLQ